MSADWTHNEFDSFVAWLRDPNRKGSLLAFTAGPVRTAALAVEESGLLATDKQWNARVIANGDAVAEKYRQERDHLKARAERAEAERDEATAKIAGIVLGLGVVRMDFDKMKARAESAESELSALRSQLARAGARGATININQTVRFRLTEHGIATIHEHDRTINAMRSSGSEWRADWFKHRKPDAEGFYSEQLWLLMHMLGPAMYIGTEPLFEQNAIEVAVPLNEPPLPSPVIEGDGVTMRPASVNYWIQWPDGSVTLSLESPGKVFYKDCRYIPATPPSFPKREERT